MGWRYGLEHFPNIFHREATTFYAIPAKASGTYAFCRVLITNNLQGATVTDTHKFEGT